MERRKNKMKKVSCNWCLQEIPKEELEEHLEKSHNDFQHKRKNG